MTQDFNVNLTKRILLLQNVYIQPMSIDSFQFQSSNISQQTPEQQKHQCMNSELHINHDDNNNNISAQPDLAKSLNHWLKCH